MKNFYLPCPKCGSASTWLESDTRALKAVLRCSCGLFSYLSETAILQAQGDHELQQERKAVEARAAREAEKARRLEAERRLEEKREKRRARDLARKERELKLVQGSLCSWVECSNQKRENSIYCSRGCSNKNARARHQARKAG